MKTARSKWLRRAELTLWLIGVSLLSVTFATAVERKIYQAQQERVVASMMAQTESSSTTTAPDPSVVPVGLAPGEPAPAATVTAADVSSIEEPAPATAESKQSQSDAVTKAASSDSLLGLIEVPRLNLSAIVAEGEDAETLDRAVGWLTDTARPGSGGNAAFAAHRDTLFRPLEDIRVGDVVRVTVPPHTYEYRVESLQVVEPTNISVLEDRGTDELTLITCYPFRYVGPAPNRFIVKATRIDDETPSQAESQIARR